MYIAVICGGLSAERDVSISSGTGAARALRRGSSLLPAGVRSVEGDFSRGDPISVRDDAGHEIARGLSAYDADAARLIAGHRSEELESLLGWRGRDEIIHRDDLVLL